MEFGGCIGNCMGVDDHFVVEMCNKEVKGRVRLEDRVEDSW